MVAVARRYWWVSSLVLLLVALVAGARYVTAPRTYIATQDLTVALIHAQALGDPGDAALATRCLNAATHIWATEELILSLNGIPSTDPRAMAAAQADWSNRRTGQRRWS